MTKKRIAMVTGVSRLQGLGRAICLELAKQGIDIFFTYWRPYDKSMIWGINDDEPDTIKKEISALGVRCESMEIDLMKPHSVEMLFDAANKALGSVSILVNNATYSTAPALKV